MTDVVQQLWGFCHTLRHDGIDYGDYIEQITYLLFLKMAEEREVDLPEGLRLGRAPRRRSGTDLTDQLHRGASDARQAAGHARRHLRGAQSRFSNPVNLKKLISLIDETEWTELGVDVKAEAFEGLLEKAASEGKKGAGQYFTPRLLIESIVRCMKPDPRKAREFTICDPACGTGGFLWRPTSGSSKRRGAADSTGRPPSGSIRDTYFGQDLVAAAAATRADEPLPARPRAADRPRAIPSTTRPRSDRFDVVLDQPAVRHKGREPGARARDDFTVSTSNKQLNFLQHVLTMLKPGGRAAVVLPDNCLFADQAGEVFKILMEDCDLHTVLRLPHGTFTPYSPGMKTNVIFFTKG